MTDTSGKRLKFALNIRNCSMAELARALDIKHQVIQYLANSNAKYSRYFLPISSFLKVSLEWLTSGCGSMEKEGETPLAVEKNIVPMYESSDLIQLFNGQNILLTPTSYFHTNINFSNNVFGWCINDQSMFPRFPEKTIIVIDKEAVIRKGCFVLTYVKKAGEIYFRLFSQKDDNRNELLPLNKVAYKNIPLSEQDVILGSMVEAIFL